MAEITSREAIDNATINLLNAERINASELSRAMWSSIGNGWATLALALQNEEARQEVATETTLDRVLRTGHP